MFSLLNEDSKPPKQLKLSFTIDGVSMESVLNREKGAFGEGAVLSFPIDGKPGEYDVVEAPEAFTYYSTEKDWVLTFHTDSKFDGLIFGKENEAIHHFVAENGQLTMNDKVKDWFPGEMKSRGLTSEASQNGIDYWTGCHEGQSRGLSGLNMGMVIGNVHYKAFGQQTSLNQINSYVSLSNTIYERQMDIRLVINDVVIATQPNQESFLPGSCSQSIQTQLSGMARWRKPSNQVLWHLIDNCFGSSGGILGIAYLGTLCTSNNVGVNYYSESSYPDPGTYPTWATFAHEAGHNFDAQHSFEEGQGRTGGIMDYGFLNGKLINGEVQFNSKYREREVCREVQSAVSRGCLNLGVAPSPTGQFESPASETLEIFAGRERELNCVKHAHKVPSSSSHIRRFTEKSRVECRKECADRENCEGFVFSKDGWCELLDTVDVNDLGYATTFSTVICSEGELSEETKAQSEDDLLDEAAAFDLQDQCCVESLDDTYSGMNLQYMQYAGLTLEQCEEECVKNSKCEAVTFDTLSNAAEPGCMLFGGREFSHLKTDFTGATTLSCDRACISNVVTNESSASNGFNVGGFFGGVALVAGVVGLVAGALVYKRGKKTVNEETVAATEGTVYKATL